jgi:FkbM family methyltransferase
MALERILDSISGITRSASAVDIGANRGDYTIAFAKHFDGITAFEPDPATFPLLENNIRSSCATGVTPINAAVSDHDGQVTFYRDLRPEWGGAAGSVHVLQGLGGKTEAIRVPCLTLDSHCTERNLSPDFIKIDVEGHEPAVISGAWQTISRHRPVLVFEFWEDWFSRGFKETFIALDSFYELSVLQTGDSVRDRYLATGGKLDGAPAVVDILCRPRR